MTRLIPSSNFYDEDLSTTLKKHNLVTTNIKVLSFDMNHNSMISQLNVTAVFLADLSKIPEWPLEKLNLDNDIETLKKYKQIINQDTSVGLGVFSSEGSPIKLMKE